MLNLESVQAAEAAGSTSTVFSLGRNTAIAAICAASETRMRTAALDPVSYRLGLTDLGWTPRLTSLVRDSKYRVFTKPTDWNGAQRLCTLHGGHLAVLEDAQDVADLTALLATNLGVASELAGQAVWVGLYMAQDPIFRWVDGTHLRYGGLEVVVDWDWAPTNCGYLRLERVNGTWRGSLKAGGCDANQFAFVCETSTIVDDSLSDITRGEERVVPASALGSAAFGSWRVTLFPAHSVSWYDAQRICRWMGQDLMWYFNSGEESWLSSWVAASNLSGNAGTGLWTALSADTPPRMGWRTTAADSNSLALSTWQLPRGLDAAASIPAGDTTGACGMLKPLPGGGFAVGLASCGAAIAPFACKRGQQWNGPPASLSAAA
ncbi:hypothetical protein CHLRE_01g002824v5 [Chlamydomonas reinhardtii]|uniref:C-type lectin domain-containing protein n=1 Tax=Chlamydomonas reinhardtii TaxID=3055 RepID=A0A2K3E4V7_CHLRE|nr:uncharacterized protein CHLRE_01g002824v5 [Chlamydomonas reinhardtii]PNW87806.1 hypothetical protein CHLRE_01g002824v5 [Chlamydomonas reinhardtii]